MFRCAKHQSIPGAGALSIGNAHKNRSGHLGQRHRHIDHLRPQPGQRFQRLVNRRPHVGVHVRRVAQLGQPANAHPRNNAIQHPVVIGHWPAAGGRIQRVVTRHRSQHQGTILNRLGHRGGGVHEPAHGCNPVPADAGESRTQPNTIAIGCRPPTAAPRVLTHRCRA